MASLRVEDGDIAVQLSALEMLGALRWSSVRASLAAVTAIRSSRNPWRELRGIRAPGTGIPRVISLCTARGKFGRDFNAVYVGGGAVVVELAGAEWSRFVVSTRNPERVAEELRHRLANDRGS